MGAGESRFLDVSPAAHRTLLRPLAIFEKCQKRRSPPHSITARHTGSHGKHRNHVTTWSYTSTDLPDGLSDDFPVQPSFKKYSASPFGRNSFMDSSVPRSEEHTSELQ